MITGVFRDDHPRVVLSLPGLRGGMEVEFIVDTGFAGDLALPARLAGLLDAEMIGIRERSLANGQRFPCPSARVALEWFMEPRLTEVLVLEGDPLLGTLILSDYLLQMEMIEGGEVSIEPL